MQREVHTNKNTALQLMWKLKKKKVPILDRWLGISEVLIYHWLIFFLRYFTNKEMQMKMKTNKSQILEAWDLPTPHS